MTGVRLSARFAACKAQQRAALITFVTAGDPTVADAPAILDALVAGGFGLIHGLAFATIIGDFTIEPLYRAQAILGFNVGIEIVQLGVVAVMLPALVVLGQSSAYPRIRSTGALLSGIAATAWAIERILGKDNAAARAIDAGLGYAIWPLGLVSLACLAIIVFRQSRWAGRYASST